MKQRIIHKLIIWLTMAIVFSAVVFLVLMNYNRKISEEIKEEIGALYMSEMMLQLQDHLETIIDVKQQEATHIVTCTMEDMDYQELCTTAKSMSFEYIAFYDAEGNYETILGEMAWYRNLESYISGVLSGEKAITTGYLTGTGGKYVVFGIPAKFLMASGKSSEVVLVGFSVEKLYEFIDLKSLDQFGSNVHMQIIGSNGSYVLQSKETEETSFFDYISKFGSFVGMSQEEGIAYIEKAMANQNDFSCMIKVNGEVQHIYGASARRPGDWYFMISMPQGASDGMIVTQNQTLVFAFAIAGAFILVMFFGVFIAYFRLSMQQIEETEKARREAEDAKGIAEQANRAKSTFLSSMSHDIRTPMNAIIGYTNLASKEQSIDIIQGYLSKISVSSKHLLMLINEVLEMSRIESGVLVLNELPNSLTRLMEELQTLNGKKAEEKRQSFSVECEVTEDYVYCDRLRLNQVLTNLMSNAVKYTPDNGQIFVSLKQTPCEEAGYGCYEIAVADNGIGMSPEFVKRVFEPFERENTSTVSGIEGTGLGLSIVKRIVDIMGGSIEVVSEPNKGSVFTLKLKLRIVGENEALSREHTEVMDGLVTEELLKEFFAGKRILVVEDNDFNREISQSILENVGFVVEQAENGKIALEKVREAAADYYDVVLMDVQMPIMNGYEATKAIRELDGGREAVKIIAVTANAFESDRQNALIAGMNDYISKPIEVDKLYRVLRKVSFD